MSGAMSVRQPTVFLDGLVPAAFGACVPDDSALPDRRSVERVLLEKALRPFLIEVAGEREQQNSAVRRHVEISLQTLIDRQNLQLADYVNRQIEGQNVPGLEGLIAQVEGHLDRLNERLESRLRELEMERHCTIADINHLGRAWVLPHPERTTPALAPMVRDDEIERIAIALVTQHEEARGWQVESVESENRGFDLISRRSHPEDPKTFIEVRFIEVKGRAGVGEIALTANEYKTAGRLKGDYWLYAVFNCGGAPELHAIQDPSRLGWLPVVQVEHYHVGPAAIIGASRRVMPKYIHEVRDPIHVFIRLDSDERRVLDSRPVQRLRHIHQLAMTNLIYPGATHRRFEHSLGVMELAGRVYDVVTQPSNAEHKAAREVVPEFGSPERLYWRRVVRMAALCHDIGHLPFSHAAEAELLPDGWDHERLTVELIRGDELAPIWKSIKVQPNDVAKLAVGAKKYKDGLLTSWEAILAEIIVGNAFGVNRMDYLLRDSYHAGVAYGRFDHFRLIDTIRILPKVDGDEPTLGVEQGGLHSAEDCCWLGSSCIRSSTSIPYVGSTTSI